MQEGNLKCSEKSTCKGVRREGLDRGRGEMQCKYNSSSGDPTGQSLVTLQMEARDSDLSRFVLISHWVHAFPERMQGNSLLPQTVPG